MSRTTRLTWQPGGKGRSGRWRKKYKGKAYYFPGGRGKSDREAYAAALESWNAKRAEIDRNSPRPHQLAYEAAIETWDQVLIWCLRHGDGELADEARGALENLRERLTYHRLVPLATSDRFEGRFKAPQVLEAVDDIDRPLIESDSSQIASVTPRVPLDLDQASIERYAAELDGSPLRILREVWRDRLDVQRLEAVPTDRSVAHQVDVYVAAKLVDANAGSLSKGRPYKIKLHLEDFTDWIGASTDVGDITSQRLVEYRKRVLDVVKEKTWTQATARDRVGTVRGFVRWLWRTEVIQELPRVLDPKSNDLNIKRQRKRPITFTNEELATSFGEANTRTRLYMLLMLNCGMTQKDISDLDVLELDWDRGRIVRKRSKTRDHDSVPVVEYLLWKETKELLAREKSHNTVGRVLLNRNGGALCSEDYDSGKYRKTDNIKNAFDRLRNKTGIRKPLISLKKTSASRIRGNEKYQSVRSLFLGQAEPRLSDWHYADNPQRLLDRAIRWLRRELGIDNLDLMADDGDAASV